MTTIAQQIALDNALVAPKNQREIGKCNMRINPRMKPKEPTYQVVLDALALTTCYPAFLIATNILGQVFDKPPSEEETLSFIRELGHSREIKYITDDFAYHIDNKDSKKQDKMFYPRFTKEIIHHFLTKDKSISMRNRTFMHTARDDSLLGTMRFVSRHEDTQVYGALLPKAMTNQAMMDSDSYKTYYAIATGAEPPKTKKTKKKSDSAISSKKTPSKKKSAKAKIDVPSTKKPATKPKPTKNKASAKTDRGKGLNVLSEVALSEAAQLKEVTKQRKKDFHISHVSGSGNGTNFESGVPDEKQRMISGTDAGTGTKTRVGSRMEHKNDFECEKESWGDSGEEDDDDEDDTEEESDNDGNDDDGDDDDDGDNDDNNDDSDHERTESDIDENLNLNQSNEEHKEEEEEEEYVDEFTDEEDNADNAKEDNEEEIDDAEELYRDVNVNLRKEDVEMTDADQGGADQHNVSQESGFEQVEEDVHVTLTAVHDTQKTEEPNGQASSHYTVPVTVIPEITSAFTTTIPPPPHSFNPLLEQATPTPTPTASEVTTSFPALPDFSSVFKFNDRVTNLEKDLSEMKQVDRYAQAISLIPAIVDRYIDNKQRESVQQAIKSHTTECREEVVADKREYIDLIDTSVRAIIKEEVKTQLPHILPQAVSDFATLVIKGNVIESLEAVVLSKSSSQPKSTYAAAASLSEFELTKILMDKMEEHKSYLRSDYKRELYDALIKSYNTDKDLFETYGEIFTLKRSRDDKDKDQDPSAGSDRGTKRRKSSKEAESSRDPKSKESKSSSSSKDTSRSQHKSSSKSAHAEEPSHTIDDSGVKHNHEFDAGNNDEQPDDEEASKVDWFKKPEQPLTPDPDWNKRQHVDFRPSQTWISNLARVEKPPTSFDELMDTPIDFSAFVMNRLKITNLTQELLVRLAFNLLKGTYKSRTELEYHFEECFKATSERLDWHNPEGKQYPFDLRKPLPLIPNHRGRHVIPFYYFINNDLEYLKGGSLSGKYSTSVTKTKAATYEVQ
ncbi:hypothetical protein Tco_1392236 [Tanacetum coccineum]